MHRIKLPWRSFVLVLVLVFLSSFEANAGSFDTFGPRLFVRSDGPPVTESQVFTVPNPATSYILKLRNGGLVDTEYEKVSSTVIAINGIVVVAPNELNQNIATLEKPVLLQGVNTIEVQVRGNPGGALSIEIVGADNDLPIITTTVAPRPNEQGWNNSPVTISYQCSDITSGISSCPGPVTVSAQGTQVISGQAIDKAGNIAEVETTINLDMTPPSIRALASPTANPAGWNNTDVTLAFSCSDDLSGIIDCPKPILVSADGEGQTVTATVVDAAGNAASATATANVDKTPPTILLSSPADGSMVMDPAQVVTGTASDSLSGLSSVTCGSNAAATDGETFSCSTMLLPGNNAVPVVSTDKAGNTTTATLNLNLSQQLDPPPGYLLITPSAMTLTRGESRRIALVDDYGRGIYGASWSVSDGSVAHVTGSYVSAVGAGTATIGASYGALTTQVEVNVIDAPELPEGTIAWRITPVPNLWYSPWIRGFSQAPFVDDNTPTIYTREDIYQGSVIRGFRSDGTEILSVLLGTAPDASPYSSSVASLSTLSTNAGEDNSYQEYLALSDLEYAVRTGVANHASSKNDMMNPDPAVSSSALAALRDWIEKTGGDAGQAQRWLDVLAPETIATIRLNSTSQARLLSPSTQVSTLAASSSSLPDGVREFALESVSTGDSGVLLRTFGMTQGWPTTYFRSLVKVDPKTRKVLWRYPSSGTVRGWAMHPDGTLFTIETTQQESHILALDGSTGQPKYSVPIPVSHRVDMYIDAQYDSSHCEVRDESYGPSTSGALMISLDRNLYVTYGREDYAFGEGHCTDAALTYHSELGLIRVSPDGSYSTSVLHNYDYTGRGREYYNYQPILIGPDGESCPIEHAAGETIATGSGGLLTQWSEPQTNYCFNNITYNFIQAHFIPVPPSSPMASLVPQSAQGGDFTLPLQSCPTTGVMVAGENTDAFATCTHQGVLFDSSAGAIKWQTGLDATEVYATANSGVVAVNSGGSGSTVIRFNGEGIGQAETWTNINNNFFYPLEFASENFWLALDWNNHLVGVRGTTVELPDSPWYEMLSAQKQRAARLPDPELSCMPTSLVRGSSISCTVKHAPTDAKFRWTFTGESPTYLLRRSATPVTDRTWSGPMVASGSIAVELVTSSGIRQLSPVSVSVLSRPRSSFEFTPIPAAQRVYDGFVCQTQGGTVTFKSNKPITGFDGELGEGCPRIEFSYEGAVVEGNGPNAGYLYVASAANLDQFSYWLNTELSSNDTEFCKAQCASSESFKYQSCDTIRSNITTHEAGTGISPKGNNVGHFSNYQNAVRGTNPGSIGDSANIGISIEKVIDIPGQSNDAFQSTVRSKVASAMAAILSAIAVEHGDGSYDADLNFLGYVNMADSTGAYPSCQK